MSNNSEPVMFKCQTDTQTKVAEGSCLARQRMEVAEMPVKSRSSNRRQICGPEELGRQGENVNERKQTISTMVVDVFGLSFLPEPFSLPF